MLFSKYFSFAPVSIIQPVIHIHSPSYHRQYKTQATATKEHTQKTCTSHISLLDNSNTVGKNNIITFVLIQFTPNNNQNAFWYKAGVFMSHQLKKKKEYHDRNTIPVGIKWKP